MKVNINRQEVQVSSDITTLAQLLDHENLSGPGKAVAVDNRLAPRGSWSDTHLTEGMNITVIRAVCGG